jgi:hypothetical protein
MPFGFVDDVSDCERPPLNGEPASDLGKAVVPPISPSGGEVPADEDFTAPGLLRSVMTKNPSGAALIQR